MPQLAIFKGEKNLDELTARVFRVQRGGAQARQASDALLRANPHLADLSRVPPGAVVVVPDTPHDVNAGELLSPAGPAASDPVRAVGEQVTAVTSTLGAAFADAAAQADSRLKLLKDRSLTAAAARNPELAQRLAKISEATSAALKDMQAKRSVIESGLAQIQQDLADFLKLRMPPPSPPSGPGSPPPSPGGDAPRTTPRPPSSGGPATPPEPALPRPPSSGAPTAPPRPAPQPPSSHSPTTPPQPAPPRPEPRETAHAHPAAAASPKRKRARRTTHKDKDKTPRKPD
jgi:phage tail protein X